MSERIEYLRAEWEQASNTPPGDTPHALLHAGQAYISALEAVVEVAKRWRDADEDDIDAIDALVDAVDALAHTPQEQTPSD